MIPQEGNEIALNGMQEDKLSETSSESQTIVSLTSGEDVVKLTNDVWIDMESIFLESWSDNDMWRLEQDDPGIQSRFLLE